LGHFVTICSVDFARWKVIYILKCSRFLGRHFLYLAAPSLALGRQLPPLPDRCRRLWSVAVAIVQSRLDYCNSLFFGTSQHNIRKLQRIQNTLARIVVSHPLAASSSELLYNLHWLPVHHRVNFKIALLTYKILSFNQPSYLASLVNFNIAPRTLRSTDQHLLYLPRTCTVTGGRAFNLAAPKVWNSLAISIRSSPSIVSFKQHLNTFYFSSAFP
jgi:hypothetical protein